ncbi:MAG: hypothetical protein KGQ59_06940 [Bdellovibrionales bacterium]|nr:hypothetical protein [Bdellovibrionales bacterium]
MNCNRSRKWASLPLAALVLAGLSSGCAGGSSTLNHVVEAIEGIQVNTSPVVEAFIQYPGPDAKWAGPVLWTIHVAAFEGVEPTFEVSPALPKMRSTTAPELVGRVPASALGMAQGRTIPVVTTESRVWNHQQIRERLQNLSELMLSSADEKEACASSVKVRMTRADGSVIEKQACRGSQQWTQTASELAAEFMTMSRSAPPVTAGT